MSRGRRLKRCAAVLALVPLCVAALLLAAAGASLALLDPNDYRQELSASLFRVAGRRVVFEEGLRVSLFPVFGLKTGTVRLEGAAVVAGAPLLEVREASFGLKFWSLLRRHVRVREIRLDGVSVHLVRSADGFWNWDPASDAFDPSGRGVSGTPLPPNPEPAKERAALRWRIASLVCTDVSVTVRDLADGHAWRLESPEVRLENVRLGRDVHAAFQALALNENTEAVLRMDLRGQVRLEANGSLRAQVRRLAVFPDNADPTFGADLRAQLNYVAPTRALAVRDVSGFLAGASLEGSVDVLFPGAGGRAPGVSHELRADVALGTVDMDRLAGLWRLCGARSLADPAQDATSQASRPLLVEPPGAPAVRAGKEQFYGDVFVRAEQVAGQGLLVRDLSLRMAVQDGRIRVAPFAFSGFGGAVEGNAEIDRSVSPVDIRVDASLRNLRVETLSSLVLQTTRVSGTLNGTLAARWAWSPACDWRQISGSAELRVTQGDISGFSLVPRDVPGLSPVPTAFSFERLEGELKLENATLFVRNGRFVSPVLAARGSGSADLEARRLSALVRLMAGGAPPEVPLRVSGPFGALRWNIDGKVFLQDTTKKMRTLPDSVRDLTRGDFSLPLRR